MCNDFRNTTGGMYRRGRIYPEASSLIVLPMVAQIIFAQAKEQRDYAVIQRLIHQLSFETGALQNFYLFQ